MEGRKETTSERVSFSPSNSYTAGLHFLNTIATCINGIFSFSFIGYFFWIGFLYLIGSIVTIVSWIYFAPRIRDTIICPSMAIYAISGFWALHGVTMLIICYLYSSMVGDDFENELYKPTRSTNILGFLVKICPLIIRFFHLLSLCLIFTNIFNLLFLPECNCVYIRRVVAYTIVIWWIITIFGMVMRNRIALPPYLYNPHHNGGIMYNIQVIGSLNQVSLKYFGI